MIHLRALVIKGFVQGFGDSDEGAYRDALLHGLRGYGTPSSPDRGAPWARKRGLFVPITLEDAKRICAGDVVWRGLKLAS